MSLEFCRLTTFSVLMKHCKLFHVLLMGRVGGGIATSLLFSVFESWLICAHQERGLGYSIQGSVTKEDEEKWVAKSLSASMYGSSLVAIGSGVLANMLVERSGKMRPWNGNVDSCIYIGGYISAFDACLVPLTLCATLIIISWEENYGDDAVAPSFKSIEGKVVSSDDLKEHLSDHPEGCDFTVKCNNQSAQNDDENFQFPLLTDEKDIHQQYTKYSPLFSVMHSGIHTVYSSPNILRCCVISSVFEGESDTVN